MASRTEFWANSITIGKAGMPAVDVAYVTKSLRK